MAKNEVIFQTYRKFSSAEGSRHIASEYAIIKLQDIIEHFRVKKILEIGLGIGSIADCLLRLNYNIEYTGTEANQFCLQVLPENLGKNFKRLKIFPRLKMIPGNLKYNLIIIDGKDPELENIEKLIQKKGIIVIEGDRLPQQILLEKLYPMHRIVHSISLSKNKSYSPFPSEEWQGGLKIIFINPSVGQYLWWCKEKICTKLKYKFPGRYLGVP